MSPTRETFLDWETRLAACREKSDPGGSYWVSELVGLMDEIARGCADLNVSGNARDCLGEARQFAKAIRADKRHRHYMTMLKRLESLSSALSAHINSPKWKKPGSSEA